jgi:hypothetical protein
VHCDVESSEHGVATPPHLNRQEHPRWSMQDSEPENRSQDQDEPLQFLLELLQ